MCGLYNATVSETDYATQVSVPFYGICFENEYIHVLPMQIEFTKQLYFIFVLS